MHTASKPNFHLLPACYAQGTPGGHHLDPYWHKGRGGLRPEGEDAEEEQARLRELEGHQVGCQRATPWPCAAGAAC